MTATQTRPSELDWIADPAEIDWTNAVRCAELNWSEFIKIENIPMESENTFWENGGLYQLVFTKDIGYIIDQYSPKVLNTGQSKNVRRRSTEVKHGTHSCWRHGLENEKDTQALFEKYKGQLSIRVATKDNNPGLTVLEDGEIINILDHDTHRVKLEKSILDAFKTLGGHYKKSGNQKLHEQIDLMNTEGASIVKAVKKPKKAKKLSPEKKRMEFALSLLTNPKVKVIYEQKREEKIRELIRATKDLEMFNDA